MRVPYPLGFYSKGLDGRIDDPDAGWKGRGVWSSYNTMAMWHTEGGKGKLSEIIAFRFVRTPWRIKICNAPEWYFIMHIRHPI